MSQIEAESDNTNCVPDPDDGKAESVFEFRN